MTEPDIFASVDIEQFVEPRFIPVDRDRMPLLKQLTVLFCQLQESLPRLKPARLRLMQLKGTLLDEAFVRKYPEPMPASERFQTTERSTDYNKAYFRRFPYQNAYLEYELAIANVAEDAYNLQVCIRANVDALSRMGSEFERNLTMIDLHAANRLLFVAQQEHDQAVAHLKAQPNDPCGLPMLPLPDAIRRLSNDSDTKYWSELRRNPPAFPVKDSTKGSL